jgi:DNA polymerase elongation subunit (family B)
MIEPLPDILNGEFDEDSLIYESDTVFYYGSKVDKNLVEDIKNKEIQVYGGYYEYYGHKKSPMIYLLCNGNLSKKVKVKIENFKPYCYIYDKDGEYKTYLGEPCEKIIFEGHPSKVKFFREMRRRRKYPLPYEADILFVRRFLCDVYDLFKPNEPVKPTIAILDIETNHPVSEDIISYAINDMENDIIYDSKFNSNCLVMTLDIYEHLQKYDWLTGWNVEFDQNILNLSLIRISEITSYISKTPGLYNKEEIARVYSTNGYYKDKIDSLLESLLSYGYIQEDKDKKIYPAKQFDPAIEHSISIIDLLKVSKKMYGQEIRGNWTLANVGNRLCGLNKFETGNRQIRDLSEDELFEYNCLDTVIPEIVDNLLGGLEAHLMLAWSLQAMLEDMKITAVINDIALLRAYHRADLVLPSRDYAKEGDGDEPKYKAAEPDAKPGNYKGIIATDLSHAYPWAVISKNISPETKDLNGDNITPNGIRFNNTKSVFIETLREIMTERAKAKAIMKSLEKGSQEWRKYKYIDFALKTQAAAFSHGIFGWSNSRMVDYEVADSITSVVRNLLDQIKKSCEVIGRNWIYCHTDSVYINTTKEEKDKLLEYLNNQIKEYCKDYLIMPNLEFKNYYPMGYIHSKARNVLVPEDGDIHNSETWDVTGMDFLRSETPEPVGDIEIKLISLTFEGSTKEKMIEELKKMVCDVVTIDSTSLGTMKPLNKPINAYGKIKKDGTLGGIPFHIKALQKASEEYGFSVNLNEKFMVIPIITGETEGKRVIKRKRTFMAYSPEYGLPSRYRIDFETYLRSNLFGKIHELFGMKPKDLEKEIMKDENVQRCLFVELI